MASTPRRWLLAVTSALGLLAVACTADPAPSTPAPTTTTSSTAPPDPAIILSQLDLVYESDLSVCPPLTAADEAACGTALTDAGKIATAVTDIVDEHPGIEHGEKIASAAGDLADAVDTATKTGCYGLGPPAAAPDVLAEPCGTLAQSAQLGWLALSSAADGL